MRRLSAVAESISFHYIVVHRCSSLPAAGFLQFHSMAILTFVVLLALLTAFLDRTYVEARLVYAQRGAYGCPLFGMFCNSHCKKKFNEGYCGGS
ncbi:hypothetical protein MTO96_030635, partial [Rhipicephalus appendiculatus]